MIRLNKYIANAGICTRREADNLIKSGKIKVNKETVNSLGFKVSDQDIVEYNGRPIKLQKLIYSLLNKPKNTSLNSFFKSLSEEELFPLCNLENNMSGLVILTNDINLINRLSKPTAIIKQKFILYTKEPILEKNIEHLKTGINISGENIVFDEIKMGKSSSDKNQLIATFRFGKTKLISEAIQQIGNSLIYIDRIEFGSIKKGDLIRGKTRHLSSKEIGFLKMTKI